MTEDTSAGARFPCPAVRHQPVQFDSSAAVSGAPAAYPGAARAASSSRSSMVLRLRDRGVGRPKIPARDFSS